MALELSSSGDKLLCTLTPPQTRRAGIGVTSGAYCFVVDVSGSMNAAASVTTDDGDKVNHGWSQLDIGKHSTNTFIASLGENDFVSLVTYSDSAKVVLDWTRCDEEGIAQSAAAVNGLKPDRRTNLMAGLITGFKQLNALPIADSQLNEYALDLIVTTDGMPSAEFNPARGRDGYAMLVRQLRKQLVTKRGQAAYAATTAIGLGNSLDSGLLQDMSDHFLHMPDPGSVGPFMVNLLAALRCTARLPDANGSAANNAALLVTPAGAVKPDGVQGYTSLTEKTTRADGVDVLRIPLGSVLYDQPRHVLLKLEEGAAVTVALEVTGMPPFAASDSSSSPAASEQAERLMEATSLRLRAVDALNWCVLADGATEAVDSVLRAIETSAVSGEEATQALKHTLQTEVLLGCDPINFRRWGVHYMRTLLAMLRCERRSNFRDQALQLFGRDADGQEALFEEQSNIAEMNFATLQAPEPSLLAPPTPTADPSVSEAPPPPPVVLPAEFMRGGGCFAPDAMVVALGADGALGRVRIDSLRMGDVLRTADARLARVKCVLVTPCDGGKAMLTRLPGGLHLTEWHPVRDAGGRWRFPIMLGERVIRQCACVYNLLLEGGHVLDVGGFHCVTLAHGIHGEVVGHPYWGTHAVVQEMQAAPGWEEGRVVLKQHAAVHA